MLEMGLCGPGVFRNGGWDCTIPKPAGYDYKTGYKKLTASKGGYIATHRIDHSRRGSQLLDLGIIHVGEWFVPESPLALWAFSLFRCSAVGLKLLDMLAKCLQSLFRGLVSLGVDFHCRVIFLACVCKIYIHK